MCYQLVELYAACRCLYYQHPVDRCVAYGRRGHAVAKRTILVGYACNDHTSSQYDNSKTVEDPRAFPTTAPANNISKAGPEKTAGTGAQPQRTRNKRSAKPLATKTSEPIKADPRSFMLHGPTREIIDDSGSDDKSARHGKDKEKPKKSAQLRSVAAGRSSDFVEPTNNSIFFEDAHSSAHRTIGTSALKHKATKKTLEGIQEGNSEVTEQPGKEEVANQRSASGTTCPSPSLSSESQSSTNFGGGGSPDPDRSEWDISEIESVIATSSSTSTVDKDALEAIFHRLVNYGDLWFLWPQVVRQCRSRPQSFRTIERFLRRYAEDLAKLAAKSVSDGGSKNPAKQIQIKASLFIQRSRLNLARKILEAHFHASELASPNEAVEHEELDRQVRAERTDETEDEDSFNYFYIISEPFLFETDPILYLEANVRAFVTLKRHQPFILSPRYYFEISFDNIVSRLTRPPVARGKKRVLWTCKCGRQLYDDFIELVPGAVNDMGNVLRQYNQEVATKVINEVDDPGQAPNRQRRLTLLRRGLQTIIGLRKAPELPRNHRNHPKDIELGLCPKVPNSVRANHNFLLRCIPFQRWATKLHQPEICRINSDQEMMQVLRHYYSSQRGRSAWTRLRKLQSIDFVQFEVYKSGLIDVQTCPSIPTDNMHIEYTYDPMPAQTIPPIGSNLLMHLFEHPEDAEPIPVLYRKIPKKLRQRLEPCSRKGSSVGWGLQLVEGMNWFVVFMYGCVGFLLTLVMAIIWATIKNDVQGAFAISGFMISFLLFCGSIARAEIRE